MRTNKIFSIIFATALIVTGCSDSGDDEKKCSSGQVDCGSFCCNSGYNCCWSAKICCRSIYPHYCRSTNLCYAAMPVCDFEVCGVFVSGSIAPSTMSNFDDIMNPSEAPVNCENPSQDSVSNE